MFAEFHAGSLPLGYKLCVLERYQYTHVAILSVQFLISSASENSSIICWITTEHKKGTEPGRSSPQRWKVRLLCGIIPFWNFGWFVRLYFENKSTSPSGGEHPDEKQPIIRKVKLPYRQSFQNKKAFPARSILMDSSTNCQSVACWPGATPLVQD